MATPDTIKKNLGRKTTTEQRSASKSYGTPAIETVTTIVELLKPWELNDRNRFRVYQEMLRSEPVWTSVEARIAGIETAQSAPKLKYDRHSERSIWLKDFIEYNIHNMKGTTRQFGRDAGECVYNGIAPFEIVNSLVKDGEYKGYFTLDNLVYIDPLTIDPVRPFITEDGGRKVTYWRQLISAFKDTSGSLNDYQSNTVGAQQIDARKVTTVSYAASSSRPLGTSPLDSAYSYWRELTLIQDYLLMGIQRDMAGMPLLRVPQDLFDQAKDPNSDAYSTMQQLINQMKNLHAGTDSFAILPSDAQESSTSLRDFDMSFIGVEGSNKMFDLVSIITEKRKMIYNVLGASDLITGENGGGSLNLLEGKASQRAYFTRRDNLLIEESWNRDIIPMILRLNRLTDEKVSDIPVYKSGESQPLSAEEQGKFAQRVSSVGLMPVVPETVNHFLEVMGTTYRVADNATTEELREIMSNYDSNASEGNGTSGTGSTQDSGAGTSLNKENK